MFLFSKPKQHTHGLLYFWFQVAMSVNDIVTFGAKPEGFLTTLVVIVSM